MSDGGEGEGRAKKRSFVSRLSRKLPNPLRRSRPDSDEEGVPPIPETSPPLDVDERPATFERQGAVKTKFSDTKGSGGVSGAGVTRTVKMSSDRASGDIPAPLLRSEGSIRSARTAASSTGRDPGVDAIPKKRDAAAVYGVAEIVLTGVKGVPKEVLKMLRERGFVVHLVSKRSFLPRVKRAKSRCVFAPVMIQACLCPLSSRGVPLQEDCKCVSYELDRRIGLASYSARDSI